MGLKKFFKRAENSVKSAIGGNVSHLMQVNSNPLDFGGNIKDSVNTFSETLDSTQQLWGGGSGSNNDYQNQINKALEQKKDPSGPPTLADASVEEEARRKRRQYGRASTLLTGGDGVTTDAPVTRRTLLGM